MRIILMVQNENAPDGLATRGSQNAPVHLSVDAQDAGFRNPHGRGRFATPLLQRTLQGQGVKDEAPLQIEGSCGSFNIRS